MAYYQLEPFGPPADYHRCGSSLALQGNIHRDSKKHPEVFHPEEFFPPSYTGRHPDWRRPRPRQSVETMREMLKAMHEEQNKRPGQRKGSKPKKQKRGK